MAYLPLTQEDREAMLAEVGVQKIEELFSDLAPALRTKGPLKIPEGLPEQELRRHVEGLAAKNGNAASLPSFLGAGCYQHYVPSLVNHLLLRAEFFTSYTPYQPEISQGMLQAIFEFQSLVCELTGMDVANASMYDGSTALAEACLLAARTAGRKKILVAESVHPEYRQVCQTYCKQVGIQLETVPFKDGILDLEALARQTDADTAAVVVQNPNFFGCIEDLEAIGRIAHEKEALFIASVVEATSLGVLKPPGETGADIAVGEMQSFGNSLNFGGPHAGFFAVKQPLVRSLPGRLAGQTVDAEGKRGFILTLQTREQHIRREKATSNLCTNEALCALASTLHLAAIGKTGLQRMAGLNLERAHAALEQIEKKTSWKRVFSAPFYNEFALDTPHAIRVNAHLLKEGILGGYPLGKDYPELAQSLLFNVTEAHTQEQIARLAEALASFPGGKA